MSESTEARLLKLFRELREEKLISAFAMSELESGEAALGFRSIGFNSLASFTLAAKVEKEFGIQIFPSDVVEIQTVGDLRAYIEKRLG